MEFGESSFVERDCALVLYFAHFKKNCHPERSAAQSKDPRLFLGELTFLVDYDWYKDTLQGQQSLLLVSQLVIMLLENSDEVRGF